MGVHSEVFSVDHPYRKKIVMKTIAVILSLVACINAEADPSILHSYFGGPPGGLQAPFAPYQAPFAPYQAPFAPLPAAAAPQHEVPAESEEFVNPFAAAINPYGYGYNGYPGHGYE